MTSLTSSGFNPFSSWQCPQCQRSYVKAETTTSTTVLFYRGTCRHDICAACIAALSSLTSQKVKREEGDNQPIMTVTCPINFDHSASGRLRNGCGRTCQGQFHVGVANIPISNSDNNMVIELSDDEGEESVSATAEGIVKVKAEYVDEFHNQNQQQHQQPSGQGIVAIKTEDIHPTPTPILPSLNATISCPSPSSSTSSVAQVLSTPNPYLIMNPNPGKKVCALKPLFEKGDNVYAAWWDPGTATKRRNKVEWFPGVVLSYKASIGASSEYGPTRLYHIMFADGDELDNIEDYYVFSKTDYELFAKYNNNYIGVQIRKDAESTDEWAKQVGWYEITGEDGKVQSFSLLTDAMRAHDAIVVRKHGARAKRSFLNIPEDYPELFAPMEIEAQEERMEEDVSVDTRNTTTRQVRTNIVSPESLPMVGIKRDHNGYNDETAVHEDRNANNKRLRQELESRRLDPCLEAKILLTDFWSVREDEIQFTEQAFVKKALFHINFFLDSSKKVNEGFSLFVGGGVVTPGFDPLPTTLDIEKIAGWTERELKCALANENNSDWGASTTAQWLKNADVGSFVILRHEYPQCPFCPKRLMKDGRYIGPVYVIGIIIKKVLPWSQEERDIADNKKLDKFSKNRWPIHTVCRVSWKRMGYKKSLNKSTRKYINSICQPTFLQMCNKPEKEFSSGATSESIRCDLWNNANIPISSDDFQDEFDYSTSRGRAWVSKFCQVGQNSVFDV